MSNDGVKNIHEISSISPGNQAKTTNKELYIIVTEDPTLKVNFRTHIATKHVSTESTVKFIGWEVTGSAKTVVEELKNTNIIYTDAVEIVKKYSSDLESLEIPWQKIIRVKTIKFAEKK